MTFLFRSDWSLPSAQRLTQFVYIYGVRANHVRSGSQVAPGQLNMAPNSDPAATRGRQVED